MFIDRRWCRYPSMSALLANVMAVGILVACARDEPEAKAWLRRRAKAKAPRRRLSAILPARRPS